jgi:hypothetical protein
MYAVVIDGSNISPDTISRLNSSRGMRSTWQQQQQQQRQRRRQQRQVRSATAASPQRQHVQPAMKQLSASGKYQQHPAAKPQP